MKSGKNCRCTLYTIIQLGNVKSLCHPFFLAWLLFIFLRSTNYIKKAWRDTTHLWKNCQDKRSYTPKSPKTRQKKNPCTPLFSRLYPKNINAIKKLTRGQIAWLFFVQVCMRWYGSNSQHKYGNFISKPKPIPIGDYSLIVPQVQPLFFGSTFMQVFFGSVNCQS